MNMSFYVGAIGADQSMNKLNVVSNNLANINNTGFRPETTVFSNLINYNVNDDEEAVTELQAGAAMKVQRTYTTFDVTRFHVTENEYDYAIAIPNAFFVVQDVGTGEVAYTRDGEFHRGEIDGEFYLTAENGKLVLDAQGQPIRLETITDRVTEDGEPVQQEEETPQVEPALVTFENPSRLLHIGANEYVPQDEGVEAIPIENPAIEQGMVEQSGTNLANEFVRMIEAQRAFTYALKMVTTSDEVAQTINGLRG